jgi:uncharacterized protein YecE (DUF72 family)
VRDEVTLPSIRVGTSGYVYPHWRRGTFYPEGLAARDELGWYAGRFPTVELNNPFYRVPEPVTVERWREAVPPAFVFAIKANRTITHELRLRHCEAALAQLERDPAYGDIRQVSASNGDLYLYSHQHVPYDLAASLAEWYSVGMQASP